MKESGQRAGTHRSRVNGSSVPTQIDRSMKRPVSADQVPVLGNSINQTFPVGVRFGESLSGPFQQECLCADAARSRCAPESHDIWRDCPAARRIEIPALSGCEERHLMKNASAWEKPTIRRSIIRQLTNPKSEERIPYPPHRPNRVRRLLSASPMPPPLWLRSSKRRSPDIEQHSPSPRDKGCNEHAS